MPSFISCLTLLVVFFSITPQTDAAYVTMARFDLNGDGEAEIVRTEGIGEATAIKIYEPLPSSYFYKPAKEFKIPGNLVQIPDVVDLTGDQLLDFYFATGSDIGIIFFDTIEETYKRQNEIDEAMKPVLLSRTLHSQTRLSLEDKESDLYLEIEKEATQNEGSDVPSRDFEVQTL